jgi:hypothetical protein
MYIKDIKFNEDLYLVHPIVRVDRAMTRSREVIQETEAEDIYQINEQYANRGETKKAIALYYRVRNALKRICLQSEIGMACKESDAKEVEEIEKKFKEEITANKFAHVDVRINICLVRVSNANSKVYQQISEDLQRQVNELSVTLQDTQRQKESVVNTYSNQVQKNLDELKKAIRTIDINKLARDSQYLDTIMNFDIDEETKKSVQELKAETTNLIEEVKVWREDVSKFDFLIVEDDAAEQPKS